MKNPLASTILVASVVNGALGADFINGNWYGKAVDAITYSNWGIPGTYNKIVEMSNGQCKSTPQPYAGGISPLHGEVSWHFRGPMHLKQFAFYTPGTSANTTSKRGVKATPHERRHGHARFHDRKSPREDNEKRSKDVWVTATINGQVVSWKNEYGSQATSIPSAASGVSSATAGAITATAQTVPVTTNAGAGNWGRQAYYDAKSGIADGLVFLNNHGGAGSGVFDYTWGMSLSYASSDATTGASSPQILEDTLIPDNNEVAIFTDAKCSGNDCGTVRPGTVAYHGFDGASKLFLLEFDMPVSGRTGFNMDMPAAWILNAEIPRTMQYGPAECSCWTSGCGEWDIFEVLDSGNTRCKSTFHGLRSGGESDYFQRPVLKTVKVAVVFDGEASAGHIVVLDDKTNFDVTLADSIVAGYVNQNSLVNKLVTLFKLPS